MDSREELVKKALELMVQLTPEQLAIAIAEGLKAGQEKASA